MTKRIKRFNLSLAALLSLAGSALAQTPTVSYELTWKALPSGQPMVLLFGDYAQVSLTARISPPIGTTINFTTPQGNLTGTIAGLSNIWLDLKACSAGQGNWTLSGQGFQGTTGTTWGLRSGWTIGNGIGTAQADGSVNNIQALQFLAPGQTANATNPIAEIWRGKWTPNPIFPGTQERLTVYPIDSRVLVFIGNDPEGFPMYRSVVAKSLQSSIQIIHDTGAPGSCFPGFVQAASNQTVAVGQPAVFSVKVSPPGGGCNPWVYTWRRGCTPLVNGGNISGANTPTLRIDPVTAADADVYECSISGWKSTGAMLTVTCYANCDGSTTFPYLSANDFQCFIDQFAAGKPYADCDGVGGLTANDFQCYLDKYIAGCN